MDGNQIKTVALVDPIWGGHSPTYFVIHWRAWMEDRRARNGDFSLMGFSPQPELTRQLLADHGFQDAQVRYLKRAVREEYSNSMVGDFKFALANWRSLKNALNQAEADGKTRIISTLIIWLDPFLAMFVPGWLVNIFFKWQWAGLYLHPFTFRIKQSRRWRLLSFFFPRFGPVRARKCLALLTLDESCASAMSTLLNKPVYVLPDVTDSTAPDPANELAARIKNQSDRRLICGVVGVLSKRKGILTLIEAAKSKLPGWFFVFAGPVSETEFSPAEWTDIKAFAASQPDNCLFSFAVLPDGACFNAVVAACDVLYANYPWFPYSSNILTKAAIFKKPLIVSDRFLIAERVKRFNMGWLLPEADAGALIELLKATDRQAVQSKCLHAGFDQYQSEHAGERLTPVTTELIAKLTGVCG